MNILFLASEVSPYASTGGLGDVVAGLPAALNTLNMDCRILIPAYSCIESPKKTIAHWEMDLDGEKRSVALQQSIEGDVPLYFLDIPTYFDRKQLYGYEDDVLRFGAFCRAALQVQKYFCDQGWQVDVTHCHDWHSALFPVYKSTFESPGKTLLTIHNLAYQGICDANFLPRLDLPPSLYNMHQLEFWGRLNPFKGGLVFADAISTVSPAYAKEIQTAAKGCGLEGVLQERANKLVGILNGIDDRLWNPEKDIYLPEAYNAQNLSGKAVCKQQLQQQCGLVEKSDIPLIGMVTRLTAQKGIDVLLETFDELMQLNVQLVILGDGEAELKDQLREASKGHPGQAAMHLGVFDHALAHRIYAGSDLLLMPSHFEPCGLAQMISMHYGTIPIVRHTGGLKDTVHHFSSDTAHGNGFVFKSPDSASLLQAIRDAIKCYTNKSWAQVQQNAMQADFSWQQSALVYEQLYGLLEAFD